MGFRGRGFGATMPEQRVPPERRGPTVRRTLSFFRPYRLQIVVVLVTILATGLLGLINPYLLKLLIDEALPERDFRKLNLFVGVMIAVPIVSGLIGVGQAYLNNRIGQSVMEDLRNALYAHLQAMPLRFFAETRTGEIQSRLSNDVGGIQSVVTDTAASVVSNITIAISTIVAMFIIDWRLTLLSLGLLPFFAYLTYRVGKIRRELAGQTQRTLADVSAITEETLSVSGILLSKTFGAQRASIDRFREQNRRLARLQLRQSMVGRWFFMVVGTIFSITPAFVYWLAGYLAIVGAADAPTIGDIVAFTTLQSRLFFPLGQLLSVQVELQGALALFDRIFEYLGMRPEIVDAPDAVALDPRRVSGRIRFRDVRFRYPTVRTAEELTGAPLQTGMSGPIEREPFGLDGIAFEVDAGQLVALVGPSGSGKTTTTYLLARLYDVDAGSIEIDGRDIRGVTLESLGRTIGFVTQETYLFHQSIRDNLRYARPEATDEELAAAARAAAIHERILELPDGYDTVVGERGFKLSGGEKQRVAIARVLLKDPHILMLDEATSSLDTVSERLIQRALERVEAGRTTIAIAHRLSTILRADVILVYERGRIIERGRHDELLALGGVYARLYHEQFLSAAEVAGEVGAEPLTVAG